MTELASLKSGWEPNRNAALTPPSCTWASAPGSSDFEASLSTRSSSGFSAAIPFASMDGSSMHAAYWSPIF